VGDHTCDRQSDGDLVSDSGEVGNLSRIRYGLGPKPDPVGEAQAEVARKPSGAPLRLSRQVGLLLRYAEIFGLSEWQRRHLTKQTAKLDPQGVLAAVNYVDYLRSHPETYQSLRPWLVYLSRPLMGPKEVRLKPKRYIGIGYTDKGSVPDPSRSARVEANYFAWIHEPSLPDGWWKQYGMIPLYALREGEWVLFPQLRNQLEG